jgi:hypothetical protein
VSDPSEVENAFSPRLAFFADFSNLAQLNAHACACARQRARSSNDHAFPANY